MDSMRNVLLVGGILGSVSLMSVVCSDPAAAQAGSPNLRDLLTNFLRSGIILAEPQDGTDHSAHFIDRGSAQFDALETMSVEISRQINSVPISSSAGGFTFEIDPNLGIPVRQTQSFGPIYAERPLTVGAGKFNIGVNHSRFTFDTIDRIPMRTGELDLLFLHQDVGEEGLDLLAEGDVITADLFLKIDTGVTSFVSTYGVTNEFDVGVVMPIVDVTVEYATTASIQRLSTANFPDTHRFPDQTTFRVDSETGTARGLGDVLLRSKYRFLSGPGANVAGGFDLRFPTGDELDLLGVGAFQGKLALYASYNHPELSPHLNLGFLASDDSEISDELDTRIGADWAVDPKLTVAVDFLGRTLLSANKIVVSKENHRYFDPDNPEFIRTAELPVLEKQEDQVKNSWHASLGFKLNVKGSFLVTLNGLIPMTKDGLVDEFSGLLGVDYSF